MNRWLVLTVILMAVGTIEAGPYVYGKQSASGWYLPVSWSEQ